MVDDFQPRKRKARTIPWGYKVSKHDPWWLEPVLFEVQCFYKGLQYLKTCSYEQVSKWLTVKTGRYLSEIGLRKIVKKIKLERSRQYETARPKKVKLTPGRLIERQFPTEAETTTA